MTVPVWPADLPQCFLQNSLERGMPDGVLRTSTDIGPGKTRLRSSSAAEPASGDLLLTPSQMTRFERFWREEIARGALPFLMPDQVRHNRLMTDDDGKPLLTSNGDQIKISAWWLVLFAAVPVVPKRSPSRYVLPLQLNILP